MTSVLNVNLFPRLLPGGSIADWNACGYVLVRVLQRSRTGRRYIHICLPISIPAYVEIYYEFVDVIMDAEKSHDLPAGSWKPGKAGGII